MERADAYRLTEHVEHELGRGDPFAAAVRATRMPMIITDPREHDNPIVFVNEAFLVLTQYERDEIMGRNCRFLQGPETDRDTVQIVRQAIADERDVTVDVLNYRKDGSAFWNALYISPVFSIAGELQFFFASQLDVTDRKQDVAIKTLLLHEVDHRVKNSLQMVSALIATQSVRAPDPASRDFLSALQNQIDALSTVHRRLYQTADVSQVDISIIMRDIVAELVSSSSSGKVATHFELESIMIPAQKAAPLALITNEIVTNALKHAFNKQGGRGSISVTVIRNGEGRGLVAIEDDGEGIGQGVDDNKSFGQSFIRGLSRQLSATTTWLRGRTSGTRVEIDFRIG